MFVEEKAAGENQPVKLGFLRLSEAIRIGATKRPQGFGGVLSQLRDGTSCAMHAAYEAIEGAQHPDVSKASDRLSHWGALMFGETIVEEVIGRNDGGRFTREQIADWLESQGF